MRKPELKLCGNHSLDDIHTVINSSAENIGIVFAKSKRQVHYLEAKEWIGRYQKKSYQRLVGVFVNPSIEELSQVLKHVPLDIIQCHGNETIDDILRIREHFSLPIWKAIHHNDAALKLMASYQGIVDGYVVDSKVKGQWGGSGVRFDWKAIPNYLKEATRQGVPCFIAGGVTPDNIESILSYQPDGIDISSGIETEGKKDSLKVKQLEERLKLYVAKIS